jgi:hypothetical protein
MNATETYKYRQLVEAVACDIDRDIDDELNDAGLLRLRTTHPQIIRDAETLIHARFDAEKLNEAPLARIAELEDRLRKEGYHDTQRITALKNQISDLKAIHRDDLALAASRDTEIMALAIKLRLANSRAEEAESKLKHYTDVTALRASD